MVNRKTASIAHYLIKKAIGLISKVCFAHTVRLIAFSKTKKSICKLMMSIKLLPKFSPLSRVSSQVLASDAKCPIIGKTISGIAQWCIKKGTFGLLPPNPLFNLFALPRREAYFIWTPSLCAWLVFFVSLSLYTRSIFPSLLDRLSTHRSALFCMLHTIGNKKGAFSWV